MSKWNPTTDDDFPAPKAATQVYDSMEEWGAGQAEVGGLDDFDQRLFTLVVAQEPNAPSSVVAIYVDWREQTVITAWQDRDEAAEEE